MSFSQRSSVDPSSRPVSTKRHKSIACSSLKSPQRRTEIRHAGAAGVHRFTSVSILQLNFKGPSATVWIIDSKCAVMPLLATSSRPDYPHAAPRRTNTGYSTNNCTSATGQKVTEADGSIPQLQCWFEALYAARLTSANLFYHRLRLKSNVYYNIFPPVFTL